ncbi:MAG: DNA polymerase III subunit delta [Pseudomonadota bacterium]
MTALRPKDIEGFLAEPGEHVACALIYGPEQGLARERCQRLAKAVAEDLSDPWRVTSLSEQDGADAATLADEAASQSFLGGRRVVLLRAQGAGTGQAVSAMLQAVDAGSLQPAALVIVEAGDLKKSSALRKACEASKRAVAIPCYPEGVVETRAAIRHQCSEEGLSLSADAVEFLTMALGADRGLLRQEVAKLILYKGPKGVRTPGDDEITAEDVRACLADAPLEDSFAVSSLALSGRPDALSQALADAEAAGASVIGLLRLTQNRILRLMPGAEAMASGQAVGAAMKRIKPQVFFKEQDAVAAQLKAWPLPRLQRAASSIYQAEQACKRTGAPAQAIAERALLRLAVEASR